MLVSFNPYISNNRQQKPAFKNALTSTHEVDMFFDSLAGKSLKEAIQVISSRLAEARKSPDKKFIISMLEDKLRELEKN